MRHKEVGKNRLFPFMRVMAEAREPGAVSLTLRLTLMPLRDPIRYGCAARPYSVRRELNSSKTNVPRYTFHCGLT